MAAASGTMTALAKIAAVVRIPGFLVLSATALVMGLSHAIAIPYLSLFALTEAHLSARQLGVYMVLSALANLPAATWLGRLSDHGHSRKQPMVLSLVCGALGHAAMSQLRSFPGLLLNSVLLLSFGRASFAQLFALARARFDDGNVREVTLATNTLRMFFSVAWVIGPAVGALLLAQFRFQGLYLMIASVYALLALALLPMKVPPGPAGRARTRTPVLRHLRQRSIAAATTGFALLFLCSTLTMIVFPLFIVETLGGSQQHVGWLLGLAAGLEIPIMLGTALLSDRLGKARLIVFSALLYAAFFACVSLARQPWQIYPMQLLNATVVSIAMGLGMSYFQDQLPGEPGVSTALYANASTLGSVLAGLVFGTLDRPAGHRGVLVACAGLSLLAAGLLAMSRRPLAVPAPAPASGTGADRSPAG